MLAHRGDVARGGYADDPTVRGTASAIPLTAFASRRCAVARAKKIILRYRLGLVSLIISLKLALSRSNDAVIYLR